MGIDHRPQTSYVSGMRQDSFADFHKPQLSFGGSLLKAKTNPKRARPLSSKLPIHLVLRSTRSWMRAPRHFKAVNDTVHMVARRRGVRIYQYANVGNHLHILIKISHRGRWAAFIRELTGRVASLSGRSGVWEGRPFTRVVNGWRKAFRSVKEYVRLNHWEAEHGLGQRDSVAIRELRAIWRMVNPHLRLTDWDLE